MFILKQLTTFFTQHENGIKTKYMHFVFLLYYLFSLLTAMIHINKIYENLKNIEENAQCFTKNDIVIKQNKLHIVKQLCFCLCSPPL